jgi:hypothetical protein
MRKGIRVRYLLGVGDYLGIEGRVLRLLPGGRCQVQLDDGYKLIEPLSAFAVCGAARRSGARATR